MKPQAPLAEQVFGPEGNLLRTLVNHLPDYVFIKDRESRIVINNAAHARILGAAHPGEVAGKTDFDFFPKDLATQYFSDEQAVMQSGETLIRDEQVVDKASGEMRWLKTTKTALRDGEGRIVGLIGVSRDVTGQKLAEEELCRSRDESDSATQRELVERKRVEGALRENQALHHSLVEQMPNGLFRKDREGRYVFVNPWFCRLKGMKQEEFLGKTPRELEAYELAAQGREKAETIDRLAAQGTSHHDQIMQNGKSIEVQEEYAAADGTKHFLQVVKSPVFGPDGAIVGTQGIMIDITELKRVEARLAYEQELFRTLLETIPDTLYFKDRECRFVRVSKSKVETTLQSVRDDFRAAHPNDPPGWPAHLASVEAFAEWLVGKTDFDTYPEAHARAAFEDEREILRTGQAMVGKLQKAVLAGDQVVWWLSTKLPWRDKDGNIIGTFGISKDVTDIKNAEEALARERMLLRTIIDNLPDAIYAKDLECRKILVNPADLKNLRCKTEAEAIGKNDFDLFPHDLAAKFYADDQAVIHGQPVHNREEYVFDEEKRQRWLLTSKLPLRERDGNIIGLVGISRDITAIKEAERKLEALNRELLTASRLAGMADVATGVLHNVGNVLNSVNVSAALIDDQLRNSRIEGVTRVAGLLREQGANLGRFLAEDERGLRVPVYLDELAKYLEQERAGLRKEVELLKGNIGHIKEIVSMQQENARMFGLVETLPVPDLVEDALKLNDAGYARHGVAVKRDYDSRPVLAVDKHKVLQILVNLLSNAKYACDAGRAAEKIVTVRIKAGGGECVQIQVTDNGVGIAPENLTRIFSQGFTTRKGGHGFGLHSSALAAKELGGSLVVHSDGLGQGATFTLELPPTPPPVVPRQPDESRQFGVE